MTAPTEPLQRHLTLTNLLTLVTVLGAVAGTYAKFSADEATLNDRVLQLENRESERATDHDILIRIEAQLEDLRATLKKTTPNGLQ